MKTVQTILKVEGFLAFVLIIIAYHFLHLSWLTFGLLFFVPDVGMLGYLKNTTWGAWSYNVLHSYVLPGIVLFLAMVLQNILLLSIAFAWLAHISIDRGLGYGLKLQSFAETHLGKIGRRSES